MAAPRLIIAALMLAACLLLPAPAPAGDKPPRLVDSNNEAAELLARQLSKTLPPFEGILVLEFRNAADPDSRAVAGRLIPGQIADRLAQLGCRPVSTQHIRPAEEGGTVDAVAMLVGEYTPARDVIYVSAKVVRIRDASVLAGTAYELPAGANLRAVTPGSWGSGRPEPSVRTSLGPAR